MKKILAMLFGVILCIVPRCFPQNECSSQGYFTTMQARDAAGIVHQALCVDPATGRLILPFAGAISPLTFNITKAGTFTNASMNFTASVFLNGINVTNEFRGGAFFATEGITSGILVPAASPILNVNAFGGYVNSTCDSLGRTRCNAVAGYFSGRTSAANAAAWGINSIVNDTVAQAGTSLNAGEFDISVYGSPTFVRGNSIILGSTGTGVMPADSVGLEIAANAPYNQKFNTALWIRPATASANGLVIDGTCAAGACASQNQLFFAYDAGHNLFLSGLAGQPDGTLAVSSGSGFTVPSLTFAAMNALAAANGTQVYCTDCIATCAAAAGAGRTCFREAGAWVH